MLLLPPLDDSVTEDATCPRCAGTVLPFDDQCAQCGLRRALATTEAPSTQAVPTPDNHGPTANQPQQLGGCPVDVARAASDSTCATPEPAPTTRRPKGRPRSAAPPRSTRKIGDDNAIQPEILPCLPWHGGTFAPPPFMAEVGTVFTVASRANAHEDAAVEKLSTNSGQMPSPPERALASCPVAAPPAAREPTPAESRLDALRARSRAKEGARLESRQTAVP